MKLRFSIRAMLILVLLTAVSAALWPTFRDRWLLWRSPKFVDPVCVIDDQNLAHIVGKVDRRTIIDGEVYCGIWLLGSSRPRILKWYPQEWCKAKNTVFGSVYVGAHSRVYHSDLPAKEEGNSERQGNVLIDSRLVEPGSSRIKVAEE